MRYEDQIKSDYFDWMYDLMCKDRFAETSKIVFTEIVETEEIK